MCFIHPYFLVSYRKNSRQKFWYSLPTHVLSTTTGAISHTKAPFRYIHAHLQDCSLHCYLDPDLECNPKRRATDRNMNTRFDSMIETISTVHDRLESPRYISRMRKKRTGRTYGDSDNAYMLLNTPDNLTDGLSFVKTAGATSFSSEFCDARDSNDSAQANIEPSSNS